MKLHHWEDLKTKKIGQGMKKQHWSEQDRKRIEAESLVDYRTLERFITGKPIRKHSEERIKAAVRKLKL